MRKLIAVSLLLLATSTTVFAAPPNESRDRGPVDRVVRVIKKIIGAIHLMDDIGQVTPPIPSA